MGLCWVFFFLLQMGFRGWVMKLVGWSIELVVVGALDCCGSLTWGVGGVFGVLWRQLWWFGCGGFLAWCGVRFGGGLGYGH